MKTRKSLDHQKLILEASTQLMRHFKPDPKQARPRTRARSVTRLAHPPTHRPAHVPCLRTHSRPPTPSRQAYFSRHIYSPFVYID